MEEFFLMKIQNDGIFTYYNQSDLYVYGKK